MTYAHCGSGKNSSAAMGRRRKRRIELFIVEAWTTAIFAAIPTY